MSATSVRPGGVIGRYRLDAPLGAGATGLVFSATSADGARFALKFLRPELTADGAMLARFKREARLVRGLTTTHVVPIVDVGEIDGHVYLVMPYYRGGSLAQRLRTLGALGLDETSDLAAQLGRALDALHDRGVLHRDVKPSNVLLDGAGLAALGDFGLARAGDSTRLTAEGEVLGTPHYLAPELIEGHEATTQSDIYALGCVLYECLAGEPPFGGRAVAEVAFAHLVEQPRDPCTLRPELPAEVGRALLIALEKDPSSRPTTASALAWMIHAGCSSAPR